MKQLRKIIFIFGFSLIGLFAEQDFYEPQITLEPIGSNPAANKMDSAAFELYTKKWQEQFSKYMRTYKPDYSDSTWMLGPPKEGRLLRPLPLARRGKAVAAIIVNLDPVLHTPEATLGRTNYPAEVAVMRHTGHIIVGHAVEELKYWLDKLTGANFSIVSKPGIAETKIYVGANFAKSLFPKDLAILGQGECLDGFAVRSNGNNIYIFGATAKGTLNGVYAFLENNSDLIWAHSFSDLGTVYTVNPDLRAVWGNAVDKPKTIQRGWLGHYRERDGKPLPEWLWQMRNRSNFIVAPGPSPKKAEWGCWREGGGHMLGTFLPEPAKPYFPWIPDPATGKLKQPEKISHYHHNICMTHPDLPDAYTKKAVDNFRVQREKFPGAPLSALRLGIEDPDSNRNYGLCQCERCLRPIRLSDGREIPVQDAVKDGLTFRSTQFYLLLEPIARVLTAEFPDARLSTYAYLFVSEPPPFQTSVQPWFSPYRCGGQISHRDYKHPIFWGDRGWGTNWQWWQYAYGWSRITDLTVLRDYNGLLTNGRPFAEIVSWDVRSMLPMGVKRFTNESALQTAFLQMDFWVANHIYWNPEADVEALRKYYIRRTFREGAPDMERFFGEIRKWWYCTYDRNEDFVNLGWIIARMGKQKELYGYLEKASANARHPLARANIARLRKTFEHWFHVNLEDGTSDAMLANAKLGSHVRHSSFMSADTPMPVTYVTFNDENSKESEFLFKGDAPTTDFKWWTFRMRIKPLGPASANAFPLPSLSLGSTPDAPSVIDDLDDDAAGWSTPTEPEKQKDGGYLYTIRLMKKAGSSFNPETFSRVRLIYPMLAWRDPKGYAPEFAVYDMQLTDPHGKRYVMPNLPEQQGNLARKKYFEGGEMGDK